MPETLESIAARIEALSKSHDERFDKIDHRFDGVDQRFDGVDQRFTEIDQRFTTVDQRFDGVEQRFTGIDQRLTTVDQQMVEMKAHLGIKIEAVDAKVAKVYDEVIAMRDQAKRNATEHRTFTKRLDDHDVRILALEKPAPPKP